MKSAMFFVLFLFVPARFAKILTGSLRHGPPVSVVEVCAVFSQCVPGGKGHILYSMWDDSQQTT